MKKKTKFVIRLLTTWLCAIGLCTLMQPGSLLFVVTLMIAIFASCAANAEYQDEKMEDLIDKQNNNDSK